MANSGPRTLPAALRAAADAHSARQALLDGERSLSYADLHAEVRTTARALVALGVGHGDRVGIWAPNSWQWAVSALAVTYVGAVLVPLNSRYTGYEVADVLGRTRARALVVADGFLGRGQLAELRAAAVENGEADAASPVPGLPELVAVVRIPHAGGGDADGVVTYTELAGLAEAVPLAHVEALADAVRPDDVADILFTSGTTGRSKGALSAHRQTLAAARAWAEHGRVSSADRYLVVNPFFHSFGYKAGILVCLLHGATILPQPVFEVRETLRMIREERVTVLAGAPTIFQALLDAPERRDTGSLRLAVTGATIVPVALVERMQAELGFDLVLTAYGLTEAVVATMCRPGDPDALVAASAGRAVEGYELRIARPGGTEPQPAGAEGEVLLRGENVMLGYLDDPEATAEAIDRDGWLHTGDIGRADANGYLTVTDRLKDMFITGGFNVYPAEIEQALARLDGVAESAVIGVPDERLGEVGRAYVVRRDGSGLTEDDVVAHCRERLANFKVPRQVTFVGELPRNLAGKVLKQVLRQATPDKEQHDRAQRGSQDAQHLGHEADGGGLMSDPDEPVVTYERRGPVALVTMNRPEYGNAQNSAMTYALDAAFVRAVDDDEVKVVVLAGSGRHFSGGHDIGSPGRDADRSFERKAVIHWDHVGRQGVDARFARESEVYLGMCRRWREIPKPMIAMVQGACIAGGLMLAWSCDFIVASDDAFFADPVVRMGIPGVEYFAHPWVMNPRAAKEFLFTGDRVGARRACELGMVNHVVPRADLESTVMGIAERVSAMPRLGLALAKKAVNQAEDLMGMRTGMDSVFGLHHAAHAHNAEVGPDALAGMDARSMAERNAEPS